MPADMTADGLARIEAALKKELEATAEELRRLQQQRNDLERDLGEVMAARRFMERIAAREAREKKAGAKP